MKRKFGIAVVVLASFVPSAGVADELSVAPTATGESGLFTLLTGDTLEKGRWSTYLWLSNVDRQFDVDGVPDEITGFDQSTVRVSVGYGITDAWEAAISLPYEDFNFDSRLADDANGLGNVRLGTKFRVMGERDAATTMAINLFAEPQTGDEDVVGEDSDTGFGGGLDWRINRLVLNVGYHDPGDESERLLAGVGYVSPISDRLDWITELSGIFFDNAIFEDAYDLTTGGRLWLGADQNIAFNFGLRTDLNQLSSIDEHCPVGGLLGLAFAPGGRASRMAGESAATAERPALPPPSTGTRPGAAPAPGAPGAGAPGAGVPGAPGAGVPGAPGALPAPQPSGPESGPGETGSAPTPAAPAVGAPARPAPAPTAPAAAAPAPAEVETIDFPTGASRMSNVAKAKLDEVALQLKQDPRLRAFIVGHADRSGPEEVNLRLSQQRADAAKQYLVSRHGLDPVRISTEGRGSSEATGDAQADRRIEVTVRLP